MSTQNAVRSNPGCSTAMHEGAWERAPREVLVGKDVLELLSSSMYVDPMTIYREYVQNAADALDEARSLKRLKDEVPTVEITIDPQARSIQIRDNGIGLAAGDFSERLCNLGASNKRGTAARGFRGVGRLAGLGYCQELIFRSRTSGEKTVSEMRWDCRGLKAGLRTAAGDRKLSSLIGEIVSVRRIPGGEYPARFFEVELRGVIRHRNDRLLNPIEVEKYLSQVAPVPFAPNFRFAPRINEALAPHAALGDVEIYVNGSERPIYRPHRNFLADGKANEDRFSELELHTLSGIDGQVAGVVWILHHGYSGALPNDTLIKGIRLRVGNVQIGDHVLLEELFPEPRFNSWAVGEVHIFDPRVIPNGRRDHFEQNVHFDGILNQLGPLARDIARRCRQSSIARKWVREFELHEAKALSEAKAVARRGVSNQLRDQCARGARRALSAMEKVVKTRHLDGEVRDELQKRFAHVSRQVEKLLANRSSNGDPFAAFRPQAKRAYRDVVELIYEFANSAATAERLVEKILARLETREREIGAKKKNKEAERSRK